LPPKRARRILRPSNCRGTRFAKGEAMTDNPCLREEIQLLRNLRAVRDYAPDPIPDAALDDILEVARWSGSAENRQPWELVIVREEAMRHQLAALPGYADHLAGAPLGIVLVMENSNEEYATHDEGRLCERIMLAAAAHGLGSCIGWWLGQGREEARRLIGAPAGSVVRTVLPIGYPASGRRPYEEELKAERRGPARKPLSAILHQERFGGG
jgi:nitroreductase